jgi:hypothetical protein
LIHAAKAAPKRSQGKWLRARECTSGPGLKGLSNGCHPQRSYAWERRRLAGNPLGMTVAAANIADFWGNRCLDPENIAGEDAGVPRVFNRWTASKTWIGMFSCLRGLLPISMDIPHLTTPAITSRFAAAVKNNIDKTFFILLSYW